MVDVGDKDVTERVATAQGQRRHAAGDARADRDKKAAKGDVLAVAQLAGIMAAKKTPDLIPLCHPLALTSVEVTLSLDEKRNAVDIEATCKLKGRTGVEMEALTAASVAALTVYDMCKAVDRGMVISRGPAAAQVRRQIGAPSTHDPDALRRRSACAGDRCRLLAPAGRDGVDRRCRRPRAGEQRPRPG